MNNAITINTQFNTDEIRQELRDSDDIRGNVHEHIMNLRDQGVREALTKLGWTPPGEESVQNQLCARIDDLERDKEVLATQVDRLEEKLVMLRSQADALNRIGSTLDLDPGADLTREAPERVEALAAHVERLTRYSKEARICLDHARVFISTRQKMHECGREAHDECLACITQSLEDTPATSLARLKAEWQAEALEGVLGLNDRGVERKMIELRRQAEGEEHED